ncbi:hypothetical protein ACFFWD_27325 [Bradyrhizobium erythrophlei]|uniref:hypothetical protein n=1 Tax=Bradyrhizobium erythrophlei TaxID=1437360 RepID=UPI0035E72AF5
MGNTATRAATDLKAHLKEKTMFRKAPLALATIATIGAAALAPTAASAKPFGGGWGGGWHYHHHWGPGFGIGFVGGVVDSGCYVNRLVLTPYGYRYRTVNVCLY